MRARPTRVVVLLVLAGSVSGASACRTSCNFDLNQPTCSARFTGTRLVAHSFAEGMEDRDAVVGAVTAARGDAELGTEWDLARVHDTLVLGFPDAGAAGTLPLFEAVGTCPIATTRNMTYVDDATLARQPRLRVQVGACADDEQVLFTGPADFGSQVLPWALPDGAWDLWVSAPREGLSRGAVWHFAGASARANDQRSHDTATVQLEGSAPGDLVGEVLARCADLDGDGIDELAIGAPGWSTDATPELGGAVLIVSAADLEGQLTADEAAAAILWGPDNAGLGAAIQCADDIDGDGVIDLVIGAPLAGDSDAGAVYVVPANALPSLGGVEEVASFVWQGVEAGGHAGQSLDVADLDADGSPDLLVGVPGSVQGGAGAGAVAVLSGVEITAGASTPVFFTGRPGAAVNGVTAAPRLGSRVAAADLDQDGLLELVAPAWRADRDGQELYAGEVRVWPGALTSQLLGGAAPEASLIRGEGPHQRVGRLSTVVDIDGDGVPEVVTAALRQAR